MSIDKETTKRYGLILNTKVKANTIKSVSNVFDHGENDSDDQDFKEMEIDPTKANFQAQMKQKTKKHFEEALNVDPSIFQYDEIYDKITEAKEAKLKNRFTDIRRESKYVQKLMNVANERKLEEELLNERKAQKELEQEKEKYGDKEKFVTSSYKKKMNEVRDLVRKREEEDARDTLMDITKQDGLTGFYKYMLNNTDSNEESNKETSLQVKPSQAAALCPTDPPSQSVGKTDSNAGSAKQEPDDDHVMVDSGAGLKSSARDGTPTEKDKADGRDLPSSWPTEHDRVNVAVDNDGADSEPNGMKHDASDRHVPARREYGGPRDPTRNGDRDTYRSRNRSRDREPYSNRDRSASMHGPRDQNDDRERRRDVRDSDRDWERASQSCRSNNVARQDNRDSHRHDNRDADGHGNRDPGRHSHRDQERRGNLDRQRHDNHNAARYDNRDVDRRGNCDSGRYGNYDGNRYDNRGRDRQGKRYEDRYDNRGGNRRGNRDGTRPFMGHDSNDAAQDTQQRWNRNRPGEMHTRADSRDNGRFANRSDNDRLCDSPRNRGDPVRREFQLHQPDVSSAVVGSETTGEPAESAASEERSTRSPRGAVSGSGLPQPRTRSLTPDGMLHARPRRTSDEEVDAARERCLARRSAGAVKPIIVESDDEI